jgi:uncharacterized ferritin-like protein (DUF455 family)
MIHAEPQDLQAARLLRRSLGPDAEHCVLETMLRAFACGETAVALRWATVALLLNAPGLDEVPLAQSMADEDDHAAAGFVSIMHTSRRPRPDA